MKDYINLSNIKKFSKIFKTSKTNSLSRNALIKNDATNVAVDWDAFRNINHTFSNVISNQMPVTNQKASGRCWGFAGLNLMRLNLAEKYNLDDFEFSQNYFMFWDKLEKANYFLENIIKTFKEPVSYTHLTLPTKRIV